MDKRVDNTIRLKPRIGMAGSLCRGNYGDELFVKVYQHWFGDWADLSFVIRHEIPVYFQNIPRNEVADVDAVVLGGGDLIVPFAEQASIDFVNPKYLARPVHVIGVGVQRFGRDANPDVVAVWKEFLTHSSIQSISTRDPLSGTWIEQSMQPTVMVESHPDLVCALPLPKATPPDGPPILGIITRHLQDPKNFQTLVEAATRLAEKGWRIRHIIGGVGKHGEKDFENAAFLSIPGKETVYSQELDDISRAIGECSLILSSKLHTTIVATMYGVPTICVNPVGKAKEFMQLAGREQFVVGAMDPQLLDLIEAGVPPIPTESIQRLREGAAYALRALGQRIWENFRKSSPERLHQLSELAPGPSKDNVFVMKKTNGEYLYNPEIAGLTVVFKGEGSRVIIEEGAVFEKTTITLGSGDVVEIGKTNHRRGIHKTSIRMGGIGKNKTLIIGQNCSIESCQIVGGNESNLRIEIGHDCMLSSNIIFRASDGHRIFDLDSDDVIINRAKPIIIGNHVWIGSGATIMKGTQVLDNSIIATQAVVTNKFEKTNIIVAGNPARVVKENINWSRDYLG